MPVELFRARSVAAANAVMLLVGLAFVSSLLMLSFVMPYSYGYSPLRAGLGFAPVGAAMTIGARLAGHLVPKIGARLTTRSPPPPPQRSPSATPRRWASVPDCSSSPPSLLSQRCHVPEFRVTTVSG
ncbi:hypothetical protein ACFTZI_28650 [Streptomyces decoyicus]|uniref:hypothetical protein n=1 Tax=Streptomyces decoyicus TaxID=249567 RepID=UPI00363C63DC